MMSATVVTDTTNTVATKSGNDHAQVKGKGNVMSKTSTSLDTDISRNSTDVATDTAEEACDPNVVIGSEVARFVGRGQYIPFALVCRAWRLAWSRAGLQHAKTTIYADSTTTVSGLLYNFECGLPRNRVGVCTALARIGNLKLLQFARANGCPFNQRTCMVAAERGHFEVLKWLRGQGCAWHENTCMAAASGGHLQV